MHLLPLFSIPTDRTTTSLDQGFPQHRLLTLLPPQTLSTSRRKPRISGKINVYKIYIYQAHLSKVHKFRECRSELPSSKIEDINTWTQVLRTDVIATTRQLKTTSQITHIDINLPHLWEARRSLIHKWKRQKHNWKLKLQIAALTEEAAKYATELCKHNWLKICDTLITSKTWRLLRYLIDPSKAKVKPPRQ